MAATLSSGAVRFARFAYPPNELGYCGPAEDGDLMGLAAADADAEIRRRARQFEGAWHYLEVIAAAVGIADPLDDRVVEAYWIGNDLLDEMDPELLLGELRDRFRGQSGGTWAGAGSRARAHHSFHVFEVYPWVGLLPGSVVPVPLQVLDQCRIRTGEVVRVDGEHAEVRSRPLTWDGHRLATGSERIERPRWSADGQGLLTSVAVGDLVALHWDWVCDTVSEQQRDAIGRREADQVAAINAHVLSATGRTE